MHPELNPFAPGAGRRPPHLVGRAAEIDAFDLLIARSRSGRNGKPLTLSGLRGVGKTVLLKRFEEQATRADWFTVWIEGASTDAGQTSARERLARDLQALAHRLERGRGIKATATRAVTAIRSVAVSLAGVGSISVAIDPHRRPRLDLDLEDVVIEVGPVLRERRTAFAVFVDEMQDLDAELLAALLTAQHRATQNELPVYVLGAGLPSLPGILAGARSYAERMFDLRVLGGLSPDDARAAITAPARDLGMEFAPTAADAIVAAADGYPYFLQLFAERAWNLAAGRTVTEEEARFAISLGWADLDDGFFPARWDRTTSSERRYLITMAEAEAQEVSTSWIADRLDAPAANLTSVRRSLIDKGILYARERGIVAFTVPGMAAYIERHWRDG